MPGFRGRAPRRRFTARHTTGYRVDDYKLFAGFQLGDQRRQMDLCFFYCSCGHITFSCAAPSPTILAFCGFDSIPFGDYLRYPESAAESAANITRGRGSPGCRTAEADRLAGDRHAERMNDLADFDPFGCDELLHQGFERRGVEGFDSRQPVAELCQQIGRARLAEVFSTAFSSYGNWSSGWKKSAKSKTSPATLMRSPAAATTCSTAALGCALRSRDPSSHNYSPTSLS